MPKSCCYYELHERIEQMVKISLHSIHGTETNTFANRKFVTIHVRSTLHEKMEVLQERQIWLRRLNIPLCQLF